MAIAYGAWEREERGRYSQKSQKDYSQERKDELYVHPPHCASVPPTPTRVGIRNNPIPMGLQLADIRRPASECRSVPMAGSHENCRKRKKEGELCGCEWIICPVNVAEWHTRGSVFGTGQ
jgi:hypothetical protein